MVLPKDSETQTLSRGGRDSSPSHADFRQGEFSPFHRGDALTLANPVRLRPKVRINQRRFLRWHTWEGGPCCSNLLPRSLMT